MSVEKPGIEHSVDDERFQRAQDYRKRRFWRGLRMQEGRHGEDVCNEMFGQKTNKNETGMFFFLIEHLNRKLMLSQFFNYH